MVVGEEWMALRHFLRTQEPKELIAWLKRQREQNQVLCWFLDRLLEELDYCQGHNAICRYFDEEGS